VNDDQFTALLVGGMVMLYFFLRQNSKPLIFEPYAPNLPQQWADAAVDAINPIGPSAAEVATIKQEEGFKATPYADPGGSSATQSIGYGHQIQPGESYTTITQAQADQLFAQDALNVSAAIMQAVTVPITQNQFDALFNWTYNVGIGAMQSSTLLQKLNQGDYAGAATEFNNWVKSAGNVNAVLQQREKQNTALFNTN
jgi:lysozyme